MGWMVVSSSSAELMVQRGIGVLTMVHYGTPLLCVSFLVRTRWHKKTVTDCQDGTARMCEERERNNLFLREVSVLFFQEMLRLRVYFDELLLLLFALD
jgi:hypothetical protein